MWLHNQFWKLHFYWCFNFWRWTKNFSVVEIWLFKNTLFMLRQKVKHTFLSWLMNVCASVHRCHLKRKFVLQLHFPFLIISCIRSRYVTCGCAGNRRLTWQLILWWFSVHLRNTFHWHKKRVGAWPFDVNNAFRIHPTSPKIKKLAVLILVLLAFASSCTSASCLH